MTTKAERIEAIAEAIGEIDITYDGDAPWLLKDDWTKEIRTKVAQAAIEADPMTEEVRRLVESIRNGVVAKTISSRTEANGFQWVALDEVENFIQNEPMEWGMNKPVAYLRDLDGTGSLHVCAKGDPNCIPVYAESSGAWIEHVLLPELKNIKQINNHLRNKAIEEIKQFILSHRDEWKGK